jgi:ERCC4-related helicase
LKKKPKGKFLLFSNYDRTFDNINQKLIDNNIIFNRLIGSSSVINNTIRKFESGEIKVLLLNASNYGSGLNLQMATDIIIYHELDLELETQVIGRAQRLGRKQPLNVYYLQNDKEKINCNNTALNLDIFEDDTSMLDNLVNESDSNSSEIIQRKKYRGKNS